VGKQQLYPTWSSATGAVDATRAPPRFCAKHRQSCRFTAVIAPSALPWVANTTVTTKVKTMEFVRTSYSNIVTAW
jgi:hypothetical protein